MLNTLSQTAREVTASKPAIPHPKQPETNDQPDMSEVTNRPESISDEQLEDVAGGMMDNTIGTENCSAALSTINL